MGKVTRVRRMAGAMIALSMIAPLGACGADAAGYDIPVEGPRLAIGIIVGQPGMAVRSDSGGYVGFDVSVATYVADRLGYAPKQIIWKDMASADRAKALDDGTVDLVVANWGITDERRRVADFSNPYLVVRRDLLVRADDTAFDGLGTDAGEGDSGASGASADTDRAALAKALDGRKVCSPAGSAFAQELRRDVAPKVELVAETGYAQCVTDLLSGAVDAIAHDDVILAGFASALGGQARLVGAAWGTDSYGVAVRKDSPRLVEEVDDALARMVADGSWRKYADALAGSIGYAPDAADNPPAARSSS